jgi:putative NIF3 family GTP cyclohydrolase 1 type 2
MTTLKALLEYTNELLSVERFRDYAPNGLQVEGPLPRRRMPSLCTTAISGRARTPASPA